MSTLSATPLLRTAPPRPSCLRPLRGAWRAALLLISGLLWLSSPARAQAGANDPSFNVLDNGTFGIGAHGTVFSMVVQPDGKILIGGNFLAYNGAAQSRIARLNTDGSVDTSFQTGAGVTGTGGLLTRVNTALLQADGKLLIAGNFSGYNGSPRNCVARLNPDGSLDTSFQPGAGANGEVHAMLRTLSGKILIAGDFTSFDGVPRGRIARLEADGALDMSFDPGEGANGAIHALAERPDGRVLIGGAFTTYAGYGRARIARVNTDGGLSMGYPATTGVSGGFDTRVLAITLQPDGKVLVGGEFTSVNGVPRNRIARLESSGVLDSTFDPGTGANSSVCSIYVVPDNKVLVGGEFFTMHGTPRRHFARLLPDGAVDASLSLNPGPNGPLFSFARQTDGKLLIAGSLNRYDNLTRTGIARINVLGALDLTFNPTPGVSQSVEVVSVFPDNRVMVGGSFHSVNGAPRSGVARLNSDGSLDASFDPGLGLSNGGHLLVIAPEPTGACVIAGSFWEFDGVTRGNIARVNADGSLDTTSFITGVGTNLWISDVVVQPDGKLIISGAFSTYGGFPRSGVARMNADGTIDATFDPGNGANGFVSNIALQPDGKVLIAGSFTSYDGTPRRRIARLNPDGSLDSTFDPGSGFAGGSASVFALALQPDGRVIALGSFTSFNGTPRQRLARLNSNGSLDTSFDPGAGPSDTADVLILQPDGKALIAGIFASYDGIPRARLARLNHDGSLDTSFGSGAGPSDAVNGLALQSDGRLVVGGAFLAYDGAVRTRLARVFTSTPGLATNYCTAGTSAIGCTPTISAAGVASASAASGYVITTSNIEGQRQTNTIYSVLGPKTPPTPFGAGYLCVKAPTQRIGSVQANGTPGVCDGSVSIDVLDWAQSHPGGQGVPYSAGTVLHFQCAIRDPLSPGTRVMSEALQVTLLP